MERSDQTPLRRGVTALAGRWARSRASRPFVAAFARRYGVDLSELDRPLDQYPTLSALFTRSLPPGARALHPDPRILVSPCDGLLRQQGRVTDGTLVDAKGIRYRLPDLLGDEDAARTFDDGAYATIYLAPRDYHRVHAPVTGMAVRAIHVGGALHPLHDRSAARIPALYRRNERVTTIIDSPAGVAAIVQVGAFVVGSVELAYPRAPLFRRSSTGVETRAVTPPAPLSRGDEIGRFVIGSAVVLVMEKAMVDPRTFPPPGTRLRMGQPLATLGEHTS